jgi:hypothetical protein
VAAAAPGPFPRAGPGQQPSGSRARMRQEGDKSGEHRNGILLLSREIGRPPASRKVQFRGSNYEVCFFRTLQSQFGTLPKDRTNARRTGCFFVGCGASIGYTNGTIPTTQSSEGNRRAFKREIYCFTFGRFGCLAGVCDHHDASSITPSDNRQAPYRPQDSHQVEVQVPQIAWAAGD